jgi:hypothetical protein
VRGWTWRRRPYWCGGSAWGSGGSGCAHEKALTVFIGGSHGIGGLSHRGTVAPQSARARKAGQRADRWTKGGATGRRVREQHVVCADFKGSREGTGFLGKVRKGLDAEDGCGLARAGAHWLAQRRDAGRFQRDGFDLGHFDQVFLPKLELQCLEG